MDRAKCLSTCKQKLVMSVYRQNKYVNKTTLAYAFYFQILMFIDALDYFQKHANSACHEKPKYKSDLAYRLIIKYAEYISLSIEQEQLHLAVNMLKGLGRKFVLCLGMPTLTAYNSLFDENPFDFLSYIMGSPFKELLLVYYKDGVCLSKDPIPTLSTSQWYKWRRMLYSCIVYPCNTPVVTNGLSSQTCDKFVEFNSSIKKWTYPTLLLSKLRDVVTSWLEDWTPDDVVFHHGSGATSITRRDESNVLDKTKWFAFYDCDRIRSIMAQLDYYNHANDTYSEYGDMTEEEIKYWNYDMGYSNAGVSQSDYLGKYSELLLASTQISTDEYFECKRGEEDLEFGIVPKAPNESTFHCVPKAADKLRGITLEDPLAMWIQEGLGYSLREYFKKHPFLKKHIDCYDQERNRKLALQGSIDNSISTLDLSAASDSVTYELCKYVLGDTRIWPLLDKSRSKSIVLQKHNENGELYWKKTIPALFYAGMGNATTFPVETLIFAAIVYVSCLEVMGVSSNNKFYPVLFSCYGDDIICQSHVAERVMENLTMLNFTVNQDKSYYQYEYYRESCGIEAVRGQDVTPLKVSKTNFSLEFIDLCPSAQELHWIRHQKGKNSKNSKESGKKNQKKKSLPESVERKLFWSVVDDMGKIADTTITTVVDVKEYLQHRASLIDACNRMEKYGFTFTRKFIIREFLTWKSMRSLEPFYSTEENPVVIHTTSGTTSYKKTRWNENLQREEAANLTLKRVERQNTCDVPEDTVLYYLWLFKKNRTFSEVPCETSASHFSRLVPVVVSKFRKEWREVIR